MIDNTMKRIILMIKIILVFVSSIISSLLVQAQSLSSSSVVFGPGCPVTSSAGQTLLEITTAPLTLDKTIILEDINCSMVNLQDFELSKVIVRYTPNFINNNTKVTYIFGGLTFTDQETDSNLAYSTSGIYFENNLTDNIVDRIVVEKCTRIVTALGKEQHTIAQFSGDVSDLSLIIIKNNKLVINPSQFETTLFSTTSAVALFLGEVTNVASYIEIASNSLEITYKAATDPDDVLYFASVVHFTGLVSNVDTILIQENTASIHVEHSASAYYSIVNFTKGVSVMNNSLSVIGNSFQDSFIYDSGMAPEISLIAVHGVGLEHISSSVLFQQNQIKNMNYFDSDIQLLQIFNARASTHEVAVRNVSSFIMDQDSIFDIAVRAKSGVVRSYNDNYYFFIVFMYITRLEDVETFAMTNLLMTNITLETTEIVSSSPLQDLIIPNSTLQIGGLRFSSRLGPATRSVESEKAENREIQFQNINKIILENFTLSENIRLNVITLSIKGLEMLRGARAINNILINNVSLLVDESITAEGCFQKVFGSNMNGVEVTDRFEVIDVKSTWANLTRITTTRLSSSNSGMSHDMQHVIVSPADQDVSLNAFLGDNGTKTLKMKFENCFVHSVVYTVDRETPNNNYYAPTAIIHFFIGGGLRGADTVSFSNCHVHSESITPSSALRNSGKVASSSPTSVFACLLSGQVDDVIPCASYVNSFAFDDVSAKHDPAEGVNSASAGIIFAPVRSFQHVLDISINNFNSYVSSDVYSHNGMLASAFFVTAVVGSSSITISNANLTKLDECHKTVFESEDVVGEGDGFDINEIEGKCGHVQARNISHTKHSKFCSHTSHR